MRGSRSVTGLPSTRASENVRTTGFSAAGRLVFLMTVTTPPPCVDIRVDNSDGFKAAVMIPHRGSSRMNIRNLMTCALVVAAFASVLAVPGFASAKVGGTFDWHVGDKFLTDLNPAFAPDNATADNGDYVILIGTGTFNAATKAADGGGTFEHHHADGSLFATGTWTASGVISFVSYGTSAAFPPTFFGGKLALRVAATPEGEGAPTFPGTLTVYCLIGSPPSGFEEGVRLNVYDLINFNMPSGGNTVFVSTS